MTKKTRRRFSDEFKADAVSLVIDQGYSVSEAARRLGVERSVLDRWCRKHRQQVSGTPERQEDDRDAEIKKLREEVRKLKIEKDILKNCLGMVPACRHRNPAAAYAQQWRQRRSRLLFGGMTPLKNVARAAFWT